MIYTIKEKLVEEIKKDELDRLHRIGALKNNGKSRPITITLVRYNTRCRTFKNQKKIEGEKHDRKRKFNEKTYGSP